LANKQPVILQIIPELGPGGAEQGCIDMAAAIVQSGGKAIVMSHGGDRVHELLRHKAEHINAPVHSKNILKMYMNIARIRHAIHKYKVDIVHVRSRAPAWSAYYACMGTGAKYMTTCHAPYNFHNALKRHYNSIMTRGERVIAISNHVAKYIQSNYPIDPAHLRIIHRGITLEKFHPSMVSAERMIKLSKEWRIPDGSSVIMLPGRITRWKGHHILLQALEILGKKDIFCVLVGSDQGRKEYRDELEKTIDEKGLEGRVRIVSHCDDMPSAYMLSQVVVSASTDPEGFGRIPIEAQAMGRPIIGTDHGGAQETIIPNQTGWLVPPSDPKALAIALKEALSLSPEQRAQLSFNAMQNVKDNFSKEKMCNSTLHVYGELLEEKWQRGK
jgi:glycosyltransferase involved in cell wall biosynthesis